MEYSLNYEEFGSDEMRGKNLEPVIIWKTKAAIVIIVRVKGWEANIVNYPNPVHVKQLKLVKKASLENRFKNV